MAKSKSSESTTTKKSHSTVHKPEHKTTGHKTAETKSSPESIKIEETKSVQTLDKETESKAKTSAKKSAGPRLSTKIIAAVLIAVIVLGGVAAAGLTVWSAYSPQYSYYQLYQSVKKKDFDKFSKYLDLNTLANNVADEQSFYLQGRQADQDMVRIQLKGQIEYTFLKMLKEGSLEEVLPARPNNLWEAYNNSSFTKNDLRYQFNFGKSSKHDILEGVSGYKTAVLENQNGRWRIVELKDNPTLEQEKKQFEAQKSIQSQSANTQMKQ
jgi:hypothetical protein